MTKRPFILLAACCLMIAGMTAVAAAQERAIPPGTPEPAKDVGQPVTVRIDLTISDQMGTAAPMKKTVMLLAADRERASVRSFNSAGPAQSLNATNTSNRAQFFVDARPTLTQDGKIRLDLSIYFDPEPGPVVGTDKDSWRWLSQIQETVPVVVENGKPVIISQSADPRTDRKVTVEVKATILK